MSDKRRLGRGLGALINDALTETADVTEIPLGQIKANPFQPRLNFDPLKLQELADSIKTHGVVQAVVVTPAKGKGYYLVVGERRCRAARMAGLNRIPAVVRDYDESEMLEIALVENLLRDDLNPIEEAAAYRRLLDEFGLTQEELGKRLGKSRPAIANTVRLLALPQQVQEAIIKGELSAGQARPLLSLTDSASQEELANQIITRQLTAREAEKLAAAAVGGTKKKRTNKSAAVTEPLLKELQGNLQRRLGTRVKIYHSKGQGAIEISFYGEEDLGRLMELLLPGGIE